MTHWIAKSKARLGGVLIALTFSGAAVSASGGAVDQAQTDMGNVAAIQRGAKLFVNYCQGCHSAQYMRYSRLSEDLDMTAEQVEQNLIFNDAKIGEVMLTSMDNADQQAWLGAKAPDLSLICLLYTSPSPRDRQKSRMPSSA